MSFRGKTIIILCLTLAALTAALYGASQLALSTQFTELERIDADQDARRVERAIRADLESLAADAHDWAAWDELHAFASRRASEPLDLTVVNPTLRNLHLNLLMVTDAEGRIIFARSFDLLQNYGFETPARVQEAVLDSADLELRSPERGGATGIIAVGDAPLLVASAPILKSDGEGPPAGTLIMGRSLDSTLMSRIQAITGLSAAVLPVQSEYQPDDVRSAVTGLTDVNEVRIRALGSDVIASYALLEDPVGSPAAVIKVEQPRDLAQAASRTTWFFLVALLIISTIVGGMGLFVTERLVFARVGRLVNDIAALAKTPEPGTRLPEDAGRNELPGLTGAINALLAALDASRTTLEEERRQLRHILATIGVGILITDADTGRVIEANPVALSLLGRSRHEVIGADERTLLQPGEPADPAVDEDPALHNKEWMARRGDGTSLPVLLTAVPVKLGERSCLLRSFIDISERKHAEERIQEEVQQRRARETELIKLQGELEAANSRLRDLSLLDSLTGISNRRRFDQRLDEEWSRAARNGEPLSLLMIDIDFFKNFNDTYGHVAGDQCLVDVASALARSLHRPADLVARYGGEEFAVILPATNGEGAGEVAERLRVEIERLALPHESSAAAPCLTISIGAATAHPRADISPYSLVKAADQALYQAKTQGRNRTEFMPATVDVTEVSSRRAAAGLR